MEFTLKVIPRTKKNSSQIITVKGRPMIIPSKQYKQFEQECLWLIPNQYKQKIDYPVNIKCLFYMPTRRIVDLTNLLSAMMDTLVKAEVIKDDNSNIVVGNDGSRVFYDKDNPRIEIEILTLKLLTT